MLDLMRRAIAQLEAGAPVAEEAVAAENVAFLRWLKSDHFVFLGARDYDYPRAEDGDYEAEAPLSQSGEGLGVLTANVIARYVLATGGFDWAEEVPQQLFPWFIMAGVALAVQHGGHIAVEWLLGKLGRGGKRFVLLAGHVLVLFAYENGLAGR